MDVKVACRKTREQEHAKRANESKEWTGNRGARYGTRPRIRNHQFTELHHSHRSTHIVGQNIQRSIVRISLLFQTVPEVMLCNEMASTWMQTTSEETRHDQIHQCPAPNSFDENNIENHLDYEVEQMPLCRSLRADESRSQRVEQDLECPFGLLELLRYEK